LFISVFFGGISNGKEPQGKKEYLDSLIINLTKAEKSQKDEELLSLSRHLLDTLSYFKDIETSCYYTQAYIFSGIQVLGKEDHLPGIEALEKAEEYNKVCQDAELSIRIYNTLGSFSGLYKTSEEALHYFLKADSVREASGSEYMSFILHYNLAMTYTDLNKPKMALSRLEKAENAGLSKGDSLLVGAAYHAKATTYNLLSDKKKAEIYHELAVNFVPDRNSVSKIYYINQFVDFLKEGKKFEKALIFQGLIQIIQQERIDDYQGHLSTELDKKYQEKERRLEAENKIFQQKEKLKHTRFRDKVTVIVAIIAIIIALLLVYTIRNLKKQKRLSILLNKKNAELEVSRKAAQDLLKLKTQFSETVSHELRTPLHGIIGLTDILIDHELNNLSEEGKRHLSSLKFSGGYLLNLINDILYYSKLDAKKVELSNSVFSLEDQIMNLSSSFKYLLENKPVNFYAEIDEKAPKYFLSDPTRLSQILINLIGNAIKFTPKGRVDLRIELLRIKKNKAKLLFQIIDTGVGIPEDKIDSIFEKFSQIKGESYNKGGTGLGLPIVKELLSLFDSKIKVNSQIGEGSTFSFSLELDIVENPEITSIGADPEIEIHPLSNAKKILIVDDNKINRIVSSKILEKYNFIVEEAEDGLDALTKLEKSNYDLILLDLHMPVKGGREALLEIREMGSQVPCILLTASEVDEDWKEFKNIGFDDYIIKPYDKYDFLQKILKYV
jgi:signal transduction histidine kinase